MFKEQPNPFNTWVEDEAREYLARVWADNFTSERMKFKMMLLTRTDKNLVGDRGRRWILDATKWAEDFMLHFHSIEEMFRYPFLFEFGIEYRCRG